VRVSVFAVPTVPIFAAAVEAARNGEEQGLILDLRGNPGGFVQAGQGFAGYLLDSPQSLGRMISREMNLQLKVNPRPEAQRFSGKVAVLVDRGSASTSELLAGALQELGRAKLFGEPSAGALESSLMERLPNGDTLQLVLASVEMPSGRIVEGSGLKPDLLAPLDSSALDQGRDPAIEAALVWIASPSPE
jgi:carboxyl-terminal processing protease